MEYETITEQLKGLANQRINYANVEQFKALITALKQEHNTDVSKVYLLGLGFKATALNRLLRRSNANIVKQNSYLKTLYFGHRAVREKHTLKFISFD